MAFYLQAPSGTIATFEQLATDRMVFACGPDVVELTLEDARKVWKALLICQYQPTDREAVLLHQG
jgi:hypothetical protein